MSIGVVGDSPRPISPSGMEGKTESVMQRAAGQIYLS
jgi:hypothetical protein